jgi:hypothetical protein
MQGFKFRTKSSEESLCTQNSGVVVMATTTSYASVHDSDPREGDLAYYGVIKDIIELSFNDGRRKIVLFECDWADNNRNKTDKHGFTLVDFTRPNKKTCPFILPSLVLQAFFVPDPLDKPWVVPIITKPRDTFDLSNGSECLEIMPLRNDPNMTSTSTTADGLVTMEE